MNKELLQKYAQLVVKVGVNLQQDQILVINSPIECADFARTIAEEAFAAGAHDVVVSWGDELLAHIRYAGGKKELFTEFPEWRRKFYTDYAEQGAAFGEVITQAQALKADFPKEGLLRLDYVGGDGESRTADVWLRSGGDLWKNG